MKKLTLYIGLFLMTLGAFAQPPLPGKKQSQPVALMNGTAHLGNGKVIENSIVTFEDGKITNVVDATSSKLDLKGYKLIDVKGQQVYPGLILPNSAIGLSEIEAVRASVDKDEVGAYNPNVRSIIAYNTDSELIPTMRFNGILFSQVTPQGGRISGTSSVVNFDAWNWEDAVEQKDGGIHLNWISHWQYPRWWLGETKWRKNDHFEEDFNTLQQFFQDAKSYADISKPDEPNLKLEAMRGLFNGDKRLFIHVDRGNELVEAVQFAEQMGVKKIVVVGGAEAYTVTDFLKKHDIPVILRDVFSLPYSTSEDIAMPYKLPAILQKAGILVGLGYWDENMKGRNLPFEAGHAVAFGLDKEAAIKMVTGNTAKILGVDDKLGTLENGKEASLVVSSGDILNMETNHITYAFVHGRQIDLEGRQQRLYHKYETKYERQAAKKGK